MYLVCINWTHFMWHQVKIFEKVRPIHVWKNKDNYFWTMSLYSVLKLNSIRPSHPMKVREKYLKHDEIIKIIVKNVIHFPTDIWLTPPHSKCKKKTVRNRGINVIKIYMHTFSLISNDFCLNISMWKVFCIFYYTY